MECSRRDFMVGLGAAALVGGTPGPARVLAGAGRISYGMVHDETRCIGCNACVAACRKTNGLPQGSPAPGGTEPGARLRLERIPLAEETGGGKRRYRFYRHSCQQCGQPACVNVCPTGASRRDVATGIVSIAGARCVGCHYCVAACPYRARFIHPVSRSADACNFCADTNLAQGLPPACVSACPVKALTFGDLLEPGSAITRLLAQKPVYRAKVWLGTDPKMYRVPAGSGEIGA